MFLFEYHPLEAPEIPVVFGGGSSELLLLASDNVCINGNKLKVIVTVMLLLNPLRQNFNS